MESTEPKILIGAGITEGLDLKDDLARFAVLAKIAWPSLEDVATARKCEEDPDWFAYQAARQVMQAAGRVCRGPNDFGATYIVDSSFARIPKEMFLKWFTDAWV
jgi:Rad3-related DNA helicase